MSSLLRGRAYVYRGSPSERVADFDHRMRQAVPGVTKVTRKQRVAYEEAQAGGRSGLKGKASVAVRREEAAVARRRAGTGPITDDQPIDAAAVAAGISGGSCMCCPHHPVQQPPALLMLLVLCQT